MIVIKEVEVLPELNDATPLGDIYVVVDGDYREAFQVVLDWVERGPAGGVPTGVDQFGTTPAPVERGQSAIDIEGTIYLSSKYYKSIHTNVPHGGYKTRADGSRVYWRSEKERYYGF